MKLLLIYLLIGCSWKLKTLADHGEDYPRVVSFNRTDDGVLIIKNVVMLLWVIVLLWGMP